MSGAAVLATRTILGCSGIGPDAALKTATVGALEVEIRQSMGVAQC